MSPKNTTIDEVFQEVKLQGAKTERTFGEVFKVVGDLSQIVLELGQKTELQFGEVFEAIHILAENTQALSERLDSRFEQVENRFLSVESQMVTKHYLDDKLADLRGDLTLLTRSEDQKLVSLVELLFGKRLMTKEERKHIMALQPFAVA